MQGGRELERLQAHVQNPKVEHTQDKRQNLFFFFFTKEANKRLLHKHNSSEYIHVVHNVNTHNGGDRCGLVNVVQL